MPNNEIGNQEPRERLKKIVFWVLVILLVLILAYATLVWILNYIY